VQLKQIYAAPRPIISVEFFPPRTPEGEADLAARIPEIIALKPAFCSVTYGAGGSGRDRTLNWVHRLRHEHALEVMCHLTCVGQSRSEIEQILKNLKSDGVENIIALRGDPPASQESWTPHPEGFSYARELVKLAREMGFSVAVAGFPEVHPESESMDTDIRHMKAKVDAGADVIITQLFFDNRDYFNYVERARAEGITVPIVPGILPFRSEDELRRFTTRYARTRNGPAKVPEELEELLSKTGDSLEKQTELGIEWAVRQCRELFANGAPGAHFYCMNKSNMVEAILSRLGS
jgi:methylenetetrahydrofolate reductase (NADPH)